MVSVRSYRLMGEPTAWTGSIGPPATIASSLPQRCNMVLKTGILVSALLATAAPAFAAGPWVSTGWWKFNQYGAIAFIDSVAGNTGTTYGPVYAVDCNRGTHCLYFDGVNDSPRSPTALGPSQARTTSAWSPRSGRHCPGQRRARTSRSARVIRTRTGKWRSPSRAPRVS